MVTYELPIIMGVIFGADAQRSDQGNIDRLTYVLCVITEITGEDHMAIYNAIMAFTNRGIFPIPCPLIGGGLVITGGMRRVQIKHFGYMPAHIR